MEDISKFRSPQKSPIVFDEFFEMGCEDHLSPFLTPQSRRWGLNLMLKASIFATALLIASFGLSFIPKMVPLSYVCLLGVYFFAGVPALIESVEDIAKLEINIDVLMTLAAFLSVLIGSPMEGGMLLVLFALSGSMEDAVTEKAKGAISSLYKISPSTAFVITDSGDVVQRAVEDVEVGTVILIKAGEVIPLDGTVLEGASSLNLVHLTGESTPIVKKKGDEVPAGSQNLEGTLTVQVDRTSADSTVARIIRLVTEAQGSRPKVQKQFDRYSKPYATTVIALTALFSLTLPLGFNIPYLGEEGSFYRAIAFLIAASPCALIIATPIAYLSAISSCARQGVLLKGGVILDSLASCSLFAFDKTGTLTTGKLHFKGIEKIAGRIDEKEALQIAASIERHAVHPIAEAIVAHGKEKELAPLSLERFKSVPGYGLEAVAKTSRHEIQSYIGNPDFILPKLSEEQQMHLRQEARRVKEEGDLLAVLLAGDALFLLRFEDTLRPGIEKTVQNLKKNRYWRLLMLTGDHEASAKKIAEALGIDEYYADLRPEDKMKIVADLSVEKGLAMIGDGVNDAPALARATVGISMGKGGSNTAIEAADVVLLHDNLDLMGWLMNKAHRTRRIVGQNLTLASSVILLATTPALLGYVPLWLAVILHEGGTILVGLNALRLLK